VKARAICTIDLDALARNLAEIRRLVGQAVRICAVVKADAYGHGAVPVSRALVAAGVDQLAVACLDEALELRAAGISAPVLVFGGIPPEEAARAIELELASVVWSAAAARSLAAAVPPGKRLRVHLEVDTGMHRVGAGLAAVETATEALVAGPFDFEGLMSHLACADEPGHPSVALQIERFADASRRVAAAGGRPRIRHLAHSAGLLADRRTHLDMVRPGLLLYGCLPHPRFAADVRVEPVMGLRTRIAQILSAAPGEGVGYGHRFVTARPTRLAALAIGYGQGYPRSLSASGYVLVRGRRAPIAGTVSMDHVTVDVTDVADAAEGDEVVLWGPGRDAEANPAGDAGIDVMELAARAGTIGYELLTRVGGRVERVTVERVAERGSAGGRG
jgi:alanine racemase